MARKFIAFSDIDGTQLTLGDDSVGDNVSVDLPIADNEVQEVKAINGAFTVRIDRGNVTNTLTWTVDRLHGSEMAAADFIRDHPQAVLQLGTATLQDTGSTINPRWWLNAKIKPKCIRHDGQSTVFGYTMRAGLISPNKPVITKS